MKGELVGALGVLLAALVALYKARSDKAESDESANKLRREAHSLDSQAVSQLVDRLLSGAQTVLVMKEGEVADLTHRIESLETQNSQQAKRLEECERHSEIIDELRREVEQLNDRLLAADERAERYLRERNAARDELRALHVRVDELERRT